MIDKLTQEPLRVSPVGSFLVVGLEQLDDVRRVLDAHQVRYYAPLHAISMNGGPRRVVIDLSPHTEVEAVQQILDAAP